MAKDTANDYIPKDYEDLYRYYILGDGNGNSLCHKIIRNILPHSDQDERETLAQDVFLRCYEKKVLETGGSSRSERAKELGKPGVFDPKKANFGGVIFFITRSICVNHLARKGRNPLTGLKAGSLVEKDYEEDFEPGVYSLDRLFPAELPNEEGRLDAAAMVQELLSVTKELFLKPRHKRDESLYPLVKLLLEQHDVKECGDELGVTPSTIHNWLVVLKDMLLEIKTYMGRDVKGPQPPRQSHFQDLPFEDVDAVPVGLPFEDLG